MCVCVEPCKVHARTIDSRAKERERVCAVCLEGGVSRDRYIHSVGKS